MLSRNLNPNVDECRRAQATTVKVIVVPRQKSATNGK
jgi:hypothetical protein